MGERKFHHILFDLDGTLADTAPDIIESLHKAYEPFPEYDNAAIGRDVIGPPLREMIERVSPEIPEEIITRIIDSFRQIYDNCPFSRTELYPGVEKILRKCAGDSIRIYIVTNKPAIPTLKIVEKLGIGFFDDIICPNILPGRNMNKTEMISFVMDKWKIDNEKTVFVGDSESDIMAAHDNRIKSVALLQGYSVRNNLVNTAPSYVLEKFSDLDKVIF